MLAGADLAVSKRTLQRDLEALACEFPELRCSEQTKPCGGYWHGDGPLLGTPLLGLTSALIHDLVQRHLLAALPRALAKGMKPSFERARQRLTENGHAKLSRWSRSVQALPPGYPRQPPEVAPAAGRRQSFPCRAARAGTRSVRGEHIERLFGYGRSFIRERLRVAEALGELRALARGLEAGVLGWSAVRELTRAFRRSAVSAFARARCSGRSARCASAQTSQTAARETGCAQRCSG